MVEESYVSFDTAKLLKKAGFDVPCRDFFTIEGDRNVVITEARSCRDHNSFEDCFISRPTQALAARWLREVHKIMIVPFFDDYMGKWYYVIDGVKKQSGIKCVQSASDYDDYETALEAGLQEAIKMVKK